MKVLHIGNIANNAYLNSKILNERGIKSDVLCYDYYHIMGCPEWEDADFEGDYGNDNTPQWSQLDLKGFKRPDWFVQGPKFIALKYLITKNENATCKKIYYKFLLKNERLIVEGNQSNICGKVISNARKSIFLANCFVQDLSSFKHKLFSLSKTKLIVFSPSLVILILCMLPLKLLYMLKRGLNYTNYHNEDIVEFDHRISELQKKFEKDQPDRSCYFDKNYFIQFRLEYSLWKRLFRYYDVIHTYGLDGIYPLMSNIKYIAFEHGTIRNFPFQNDMLGICAYMSYKYADGVFITNADNIKAAERICINNFTFIPHPINEDVSIKIGEENIEDLYQRYNTNFIAFHPPRQHWTEKRGDDWQNGVEFFQDWEKGNDIFIKGFAKFVLEVNPKALAIFILWGKKIEESKRLINELGISQNIIWLKPMHNYNMIKVIKSSDILVDQFTLGAFGSTMPKGLMCHKPAMMYLNESLHKWCLDKMPPILNVKNEMEVFYSLKTLYEDKVYVHKLQDDALLWYRKYHSNNFVYQKLLSMYNQIQGK